jgi:hypothetical protein
MHDNGAMNTSAAAMQHSNGARPAELNNAIPRGAPYPTDYASVARAATAPVGKYGSHRQDVVSNQSSNNPFYSTQNQVPQTCRTSPVLDHSRVDSQAGSHQVSPPPSYSFANSVTYRHPSPIPGGQYGNGDNNDFTRANNQQGAEYASEIVHVLSTSSSPSRTSSRTPGNSAGSMPYMPPPSLPPPSSSSSGTNEYYPLSRSPVSNGATAPPTTTPESPTPMTNIPPQPQDLRSGPPIPPRPSNEPRLVYGRCMFCNT